MAIGWLVLAAVSPQRKLLLSAAVCGGVALVAAPLRDILDPANMVMLFLLGVLLVAATLGRNPAVLAAVLSVLLFDVFFVPPHFSLAVSNLQYLITFAVMLITALIVAHLTASLKEQAAAASRRERRTRALYEVASRLAGALEPGQVQAAVAGFVAGEFSGRCHLLLGDERSRLQAAAEDWSRVLAAGERAGAVPAERIVAVVLAVFDSAQRTIDPAAAHSVYLPLKAPMRVRGVLVVQPAGRPTADDLVVLDTLSSLAAIAVERLHYVQVAQQSEVAMVSERLRTSILSALSHDLRTPLTVLVGLADSIALAAPELPAPAHDSLLALREQAGRLASLVGNLLEMARLHAGAVRLRLEWQSLEEMVGSSLKLLGDALGQHRVRVDLPRDLPLLRCDAVLIERVLCNLLENAAKYSPGDGEIRIAAQVLDDSVEFSVSDQGPGFPAALLGQAGDLFVRGNGESAIPGAGLGLAICRAIVEAHAGCLRIETLPTAGGCVVVSLPRGEPPEVEVEVS